MTQRNQPAQQSYISLNGEYITPTQQTRGNLLVVGIGAVAIVAFVLVIVLLIFWAVLAPIILWAGILTGAAAFLSVCTVGFIKAQGHYKHNKIQWRVVGLEIEHKEAEVDRARYEADKARYEADTQRWLSEQEEAQAAHLWKRLDFVTIDNKQALYHIGSGAMAYIPPTVQERNLLTAGAQAEPDTQPPNVVDVMQSWRESLAVYSGQQNGKTNAAVSIAYSWQLPTIFVGFRARKNEHYFFDGMQLYIEQQRAGNIERGIAAALAALTSSEPVCIFLDDLTNLPDYADTNHLIKLIGTQAQAHDTRVIVTIHDLSMSSFGLESGTRLIRNFALLDIPPAIKDKQTLQPVSFAQRAMLYAPGAWRNGVNGVSGDGDLVQLPGRFVNRKPFNEDEQLRREWASYKATGKPTKESLIEAYVGAKNGKTQAKFEAMIEGLGLEV